jgi:hypothetical protein
MHSKENKGPIMAKRREHGEGGMYQRESAASGVHRSIWDS